MKRSELLADCRDVLDDSAEPYRWSDAKLTTWLNEAVKEACLRGRLLRDTDIDTAVTQVSVVANTQTYEIDNTILIVRRAQLLESARRDPLCRTTIEQLDQHLYNWRTDVREPRYCAVNYSTRRLTLAPVPDQSYTLQLTVDRVPTESEELVSDSDIPVIQEIYHSDLKHWVAYRAYERRDEETVNDGASMRHLEIFTRRFGERPSAWQLHQWQHDRVRGAKAHFI